MSEPTRLEDLRVSLMRLTSPTPANRSDADLVPRPATTADLVAALRAEGFIVIGRDEHLPASAVRAAMEAQRQVDDRIVGGESNEGEYESVEAAVWAGLRAMASVQEATK